MVANDGGSGREASGRLSDLGGAMRAEWRAEQEQATADAAAQRRQNRTLADWFEERMNAGDRVAVTVSGQRFAGYVEELGPDLIGLRCVFGRADLHLIPGVPIAIETVDKATAGGQRAREHRSFADVLRARDGQAASSVGTLQDPDGVDGTLQVGRDFVVVVTRHGKETVVPYDNILWVSARRD